ncbi:MAG: Gfo/Idh/MocA family oxidoreductase [Candidatus Hydrogenedentota bacterium]
MSDDESSGYGLSGAGASEEFDAPALDYLPPKPKLHFPKIGLIGCGGISEYHLRAYREMGLDVLMVCDVNEEAATSRRDEFYPDAEVTTDYAEVLANDDIEVVDVTTHADVRVDIVEAALLAGKHVLSQKPFVLNLADGKRLADISQERGELLAVNQNGRWAPHFSYMHKAIEAGLIGRVGGVSISMQWDHRWVKGTPFDEMEDLILFDFAIHWFDMCCVFFAGQDVVSVSASGSCTPYQTNHAPLLSQVMIQFDEGQATLSFNGDTEFGQQDTTVVCGEKGTLRSSGPSLTEQTVTLYTAEGHATPELAGDWFTNGFQGTMGELLCAIEEGRQPYNNARGNLRSLAVCYAALASAGDGGAPKVPEQI